MNITTSKNHTPTLTPPEALEPVGERQALELFPLPEETQARVARQVEAFARELLSGDLNSEAFRGKLDSAFQLGRDEISSAASLMSGRFMERNFVGMERSPAFQCIQDMRGFLDELSPGRQGDLLQPRKILGIIPFGNRLQAYFRKYQSAGRQLQAIMTRLYAARDDMQRDAVEIESLKAKLWEAMLRLRAAISFAEQLDATIAARVDALKASDPLRARTLEQEVLFYARQNLQDMQTQMAVTVNGYLSMDVLKRTSREMVNGCNRIATTGMSALATAQTVARATGNQIQVMEMLDGVNGTIGSLVTETSRQLGRHVEKTGEFAANPLVAVQAIQEMFDNTFKAMDAMDEFRSKAIEAMSKNNQMLQGQIVRAERYLDRARAAGAKPVFAAEAGPVQL